MEAEILPCTLRSSASFVAQLKCAVISFIEVHYSYEKNDINRIMQQGGSVMCVRILSSDSAHPHSSHKSLTK